MANKENINGEIEEEVSKKGDAPKTSKPQRKRVELEKPYYVLPNSTVRALVGREKPSSSSKSMGVVGMGRPSQSSDRAMKIIAEQNDKDGNKWGELENGGWVQLTFCFRIN